MSRNTIKTDSHPTLTSFIKKETFSNLNTLYMMLFVESTPFLWKMAQHWRNLKQKKTTQIQVAEKQNEKKLLEPEANIAWLNPSKKLVDLAVDR